METTALFPKINDSWQGAPPPTPDRGGGAAVTFADSLAQSLNQQNDANKTQDQTELAALKDGLAKITKNLSSVEKKNDKNISSSQSMGAQGAEGSSQSAFSQVSTAQVNGAQVPSVTKTDNMQALSQESAAAQPQTKISSNNNVTKKINSSLPKDASSKTGTQSIRPRLDQRVVNDDSSNSLVPPQGTLNPGAAIGLPTANVETSLLQQQRITSPKFTHPQQLSTQSVLPQMTQRESSMASATTQTMQTPPMLQAAPAPAAMPVLQPIVIQMPLALPVEVLEIEDYGAPIPSQHSHALNSTEDLFKLRQILNEGFNQNNIKSFDHQSGVQGTKLLGQMPLMSQMSDALLSKGTDNLNNKTHSSKRSLDEKLEYILPQVIANTGGNLQNNDTVGVGNINMNITPLRTTLDSSNVWTLAKSVQDLSNRGGGLVKLRLHPAELGELTISVEQVQGKGNQKTLSVRFMTDNESAQEAIASALPDLKSHLKAQHYNIAHMDVNMAQDSIATRTTGSDHWFNDQRSSQQSWGQEERRGNQNGQDSWDQFFMQQNMKDGQNRRQKSLWDAYAMGAPF